MHKVSLTRYNMNKFLGEPSNKMMVLHMFAWWWTNKVSVFPLHPKGGQREGKTNLNTGRGKLDSLWTDKNMYEEWEDRRETRREEG